MITLKHWIYLLVVTIGIYGVAGQACLATSISGYKIYLTTYSDDTLLSLPLLPNGQILSVTTGYRGTYDFVLTSDFHYLFANDESPGVDQFQIESNGDLTFLENTSPHSSLLDISPNNQLLIGSDPDGTWLYHISSNGNLYGVTTVSPDNLIPKVDPLGRIFFTYYGNDSIGGVDLRIYSIDYITPNISLTTTFWMGDVGAPAGYTFTPNGELGFVYSNLGVVNSIDDILVVKINSTSSTLTFTTTQAYHDPIVTSPPHGYIDLAVSPYGNYLLGTAYFQKKIDLLTLDASGDTIKTIQYLYVNNDSTNVTSPWLLRLTPDGRMAVVDYLDSNQNEWLTTAFVNVDGTLQWTGYTFNIQQYDGGGDRVEGYVIVPLYMTAVPSDQWMLLNGDD